MLGDAFVLGLAALVLVGLSVAAMAIGVMFRRPCLRGSCGGKPVLDGQGRTLSCATCPNRKPPAPVQDVGKSPAPAPGHGKPAVPAPHGGQGAA